MPELTLLERAEQIRDETVKKANTALRVGGVLVDIIGEFAGYEPGLGNPDTDGKALVSTAAGVRSWVTLPAPMVYPGVGIPLSTGSAWGTSITNNSANWNTAYGWGNHAGLYLTAATVLAQTKALVTHEFFTAYNASTGVFSSARPTWTNVDGKPTVFAPENHTLIGTHHTVSGLTTGHFLKATGATTYGFAAHGLTKTDIGLSAVENTALSTWAGSTNITTIGTLATGSVPWANVTSRASTLSGYGITDAVPNTRTVNSKALSANITLTASDVSAEPALGNPSVSGYLLSSTTAGVRSWVAAPSSMVYPSAGIAVSTGSAWTTSLSSTTVGQALLALTNPSAITFIRINAANTVSALNATDFRNAIGAGVPYTHPNHSGDVTSVADGATTIAATAISGKTSKTTLAGTEEVLINDGGTLKKATAQAIADLGGGGGGGGLEVISEITINTTLSSSHANKYIPVNNASARSLTINGSVFAANDVIAVEQTGAGVVTIIQGSGMTLNGALKTWGQYSVVYISFKSATVATVIGGSL
jgi:hypothetical protein